MRVKKVADENGDESRNEFHRTVTANRMTDHKSHKVARFEVLTATNVNMNVFRIAETCSLVEA